MNFDIGYNLTKELECIFNSLQMPGAEISCAVIDMSGEAPLLFGYNMEKFQYPASVVKLFVAGEVLRQIDVGLLTLDQVVEIAPINVVGDPRNIFSQKHDPSLLDQHNASIDSLLSAMLSSSSNTASNVLIDLVSRESINVGIVQRFNWHGSELTRKFLSRDKEDVNYRNAPMTKSCARHLCEFVYLVENNGLISEFVSTSLRGYMQKCKDPHNVSLSLNEFDNYYHKNGSVETGVWSYGLVFALKSLLRGSWKKDRWLNDCGIVYYRRKKYAICMLTHCQTYFNNQLFPMKMISEKILAIISASDL